MKSLHPLHLKRVRESIHLSGAGWTFMIIKCYDVAMYPIAHVNTDSGMRVDINGKIITENEP